MNKTDLDEIKDAVSGTVELVVKKELMKFRISLLTAVSDEEQEDINKNFGSKDDYEFDDDGIEVNI